MKATKVVFLENGIQKLYRFPNGYGASVICTRDSYGGRDGLWELAVLRWVGPGLDREDRVLDETTPVGDVSGYLTDGEVEELLLEIAHLVSPLEIAAKKMFTRLILEREIGDNNEEEM